MLATIFLCLNKRFNGHDDIEQRLDRRVIMLIVKFRDQMLDEEKPLINTDYILNQKLYKTKFILYEKNSKNENRHLCIGCNKLTGFYPETFFFEPTD